MRILLTAPEPFYEERGTPIAVRMLAETLCEFGHEVDLLVYHCGTDITVPGLRLFRAGRPPGVDNVPIGISWRKLACDAFLVVRMIQLVTANRYDVVHAVEETVFPAAVLGVFSGSKLVYDMDSSLSQQLTDTWWLLKPLRWLFESAERIAVRRASVVLPVCEALAAKVRPWIDSHRVIVIPDIPMGEPNPPSIEESLRTITVPGSVIGLYVGNLARHQGINLLIEAMKQLDATVKFQMIVLGGTPADLGHYRKRVQNLALANRIHFLGPRPLALLNSYLSQADVLVSPRTLGQNVPMKVYSYMQAGKAILATDIRSHTQVLDADCAELVAANPIALAAGIERLAGDAARRASLGNAAREKAKREYSPQAYRSKLRHAYRLVAQPGPAGR